MSDIEITELVRQFADVATETLIQTATDDPDYKTRRGAAFALYHRGLRNGIEIAEDAADRARQVAA